MATIKVKTTASTVPANLGYGELGIAKNKLYFGNSSSTPVQLSFANKDAYATGAGDTAGTWTVTIPNITEYYDGLTIAIILKTSYNGTFNTLNVNGLGKKLVWHRYNSRLTSHVPQYSALYLTYFSSAGTYTSPEPVTYTDGWVLQTTYLDGTDSYVLRWQGNVIFGEACLGYHLLMEGTDGRFYPVTSGGNSGSTTNTVTSAELIPGGKMLYYGSSTDYSAGATGGAYSLYEGIYSGEGEYWMNKSSGWATANKPFYIVGSINSNGNIVLDGSGGTGNTFLTQTLPTSEDGKIYVEVGTMHNTYDTWRLHVDHPIFEYKDGKLRQYIPNHIQSIADGGTGATTAALARTALGLGTAATTASSDYAPSGHTTSSDHDGRYYTETEVDAKIYLKSNTDNRSIVTVPNDYNSKFEIKGLKTNSVIGITGAGTYSALLGIRGWTDSSGGNSHELAFDGNGEIFHRHGATTTWNAWDKLAKQSWVTGLGYTTSSGVTSIATSGAISGGTITSTGTISHLDTAGYKHIPTGGATGQILQYSASGTATWYTPPWTTNTGTVTSINMTVPTGLSISGNPITSSGTLALSLSSGYTIPSTTAMANAATAYGWGNHASAGYITSATLAAGATNGYVVLTTSAGTANVLVKGLNSMAYVANTGTTSITTVGTLSTGTIPWSLISSPPANYTPASHNQATLNGTASTAPSFYAPTTNGTTGYILKASTSGAPNWALLTSSEVTTALGFSPTSSSGVTSVSLAGGTNNGTLKLTVNGSTTDNIAVTGLGSMAYVANTGTTAITTLGTIGTGTWNATAIAANKGGTGLTSISTNQLLFGSASNVISALAAPTTSGLILRYSSGTTPNIFWGADNNTEYNAGTGLTLSGSTFSLQDIASGSTLIGAVAYNGTTQAAGKFYGGTAASSNTTRLNYSGSFYANGVYCGVDSLFGQPIGMLPVGENVLMLQGFGKNNLYYLDNDIVNSYNILHSGNLNLNAAGNYTPETAFFAPTTGGTASRILLGNGVNAAPIWSSTAIGTMAYQSSTSFVGAYAPILSTTATSLTLSSSYKNYVIVLSSVSTINLSMIASTAGTQITIVKSGASGTINFVPASGQTLNGSTATKTLTTQWKAITLVAISTSAWVGVGF